MKLIKKVTVAFIYYICFISVVYGLSQYTLNIPSSGAILTPPELQSNPDSMDWGNVNISDPVLRSTNLTNIGDQTLSNLNMTVSDVVGLTSYTLTWDAEDLSINSQAYLIVNFTLTVYTYTDTSFSFNIKINGEY